MAVNECERQMLNVDLVIKKCHTCGKVFSSIRLDISGRTLPVRLTIQSILDDIMSQLNKMFCIFNSIMAGSCRSGPYFICDALPMPQTSAFLGGRGGGILLHFLSHDAGEICQSNQTFISIFF